MVCGVSCFSCTAVGPNSHAIPTLPFGFSVFGGRSVYAEQVYGIPPEQVVGSMGGTKYGHDAKREYPYGPAQGLADSKVGTFPQALYDDAKKHGWIVISMKDDWKRLFPFDK